MHAKASAKKVPLDESSPSSLPLRKKRLLAAVADLVPEMCIITITSKAPAARKTNL